MDIPKLLLFASLMVTPYAIINDFFGWLLFTERTRSSAAWCYVVILQPPQRPVTNAQLDLTERVSNDNILTTEYRDFTTAPRF